MSEEQTFRVTGDRRIEELAAWLMVRGFMCIFLGGKHYETHDDVGALIRPVDKVVPPVLVVKGDVLRYDPETKSLMVSVE